MYSMRALKQISQDLAGSLNVEAKGFKARPLRSSLGGRAKITANYDAWTKYHEDQGVRQVIEITYGDFVVVHQLLSAL